MVPFHICLPSLELKIYAYDLRIGLSKGKRASKAEMLKWTGKETHVWISDMFNHALQHGMSYTWTTNWIKPLGGDVNNVNNY